MLHLKSAYMYFEEILLFKKPNSSIYSWISKYCNKICTYIRIGTNFIEYLFLKEFGEEPLGFNRRNITTIVTTDQATPLDIENEKCGNSAGH